ncbi:TetR/AcrR family transcriptional regulator [Saccharomonospora xinjiangensis]|uniref:TetR/AcrR family transcriptional regulator n=1 Tax=Saccharomonospora xinjiangensis TaxID=75294 RepID=UPI00350F741D
MPARIDPDQRRRHVVEAAFRCVVAEGIDGASLRKVAAEAGLNIGSVRHYFDGHVDLLVAAATEAGDRMGARLARHPIDAFRDLTEHEALDALQNLVEEVLPVDDERRDEAIVVVEFLLASRLRPALAPFAGRMATDLHEVVAGALEAVGAPNPEDAARQLTSLIGGLTIDTVTPHGALSVEQLRRTLRDHLRLLLTQCVRA